MPDMDKLLNAIDLAEDSAYGSDTDSELASQRELAVRLYLGKNVDPAPEGRSNVIDRSVYETVQWILPSLTRIFAGGDDVVEFDPVGPEDEAGAKQESEYLNHLVTQRNQWFNICYEWFTDALLTKNAYCWAYMHKARTIELEEYKNQPLESVALLLQDPGVQIVGQDVSEESPDLMTVQIRRTKETPKLCLEVLPPERCKVSQHAASMSLTEADYFEYWDLVPISELRKEGYDVPDDIADAGGDETEEDRARDLYDENARLEDERNAEMRRVKTRHVWIKHDYDEDGIAELQYVLLVGRKVLLREEATRIPVACIVPNPLPHRHVGLSVADMVLDIQRIKTAVLRQGLDNLYFANNPAIAFDKNLVNLDDVLVSRPGQRIRVDGSPQTAFMPVAQPFVFPQAMEGLEYMDQVRENRTGTNRYFTGVDQNALNKTATGIQQLSTMAAQRVELIARVFSAGIRDLFSICHELVLKSGHRQEVVKLRGNWVQVDPSTWRARTDMRISVGYAAGNKDAMLGRLLQIAQLQEKALAGGLPVVTPENVYQTAIEITKAADFSAPERFWTDPQRIPPRPPPQPDVTIVTAEQIRSQTELKTTEMDNATKLQIEQMKQQLEAAKIQLQPAMEREKAQIGFQAKQAELEQTAQLERERMRAGFDMESHKAALAPEMVAAKQTTDSLAELRQVIEQSNATQTDMIVRAFTELLSAIRTPREVVRGPDGRIVGTRSATVQ